MAEGVDTSSYRLPTQPSALDTVGKLQGLQQGAQAIEQGRINIDKSKLELVNQGLDYMTREINSLPPYATPQNVFKVLQGAVNQKYLSPEMYSQAVKEIPTDQKDMPAFKDRFIARALHAKEALEYYAGQPGTINTGQTLVPTRVSPRPGFGIQAGEGAPIQLQAPPTTSVVSPQTGQPQLYGPQSPQLAPGTTSRPGAPPMALPVGPVASPAIKGQSSNFGGNVLGATVEAPTPAQSVADRFPNIPRGPATGLAPGVAEAETIAGGESGKQLAQARAGAANFQRDVFPLAQAIPALEKLGTKGTGPGTETLNNLKSFVLSNVPGISDKDPVFNSVPTYDKAKKYLTDFVNQTGNSGTNDKLAAAFAGNPSVGISNAAAVDVAKSALSLRRMQQANIQEFERLNLPASSYSQWLTKRSGEMDPRAFGVDMMSPEAKQKLSETLKKNKVERDRFEKSLEIAHSLGFITPSGQ